MHFEILVEDKSGKTALEVLVPKIIGQQDTFRIHPYKGIGRIPKNMRDAEDASKRILLENLPKLLKGYGRTFDGYPENFAAAVIVVCDLDDKCLKRLRQELFEILNTCNPRPLTRFCIAIEEGEAWLLGDMNAVRTAYPAAKHAILNTYTNDSVCGTWEKLADAVYPGGVQALLNKGWQEIGAEKSRWAENITPHMDITRDASPSFCHFRDKILALLGAN
ncbi:MAG: hypothetical protein AB1733_07205 [Thermodesulfobacteriota bacterium]